MLITVLYSGVAAVSLGLCECALYRIVMSTFWTQSRIIILSFILLFLSTWLIACVDFIVCRCIEHSRFPYEQRDAVTVVRNPHWASDLFVGYDDREHNVNLTVTFARMWIVAIDFVLSK